jgi:hypothetical protein
MDATVVSRETEALYRGCSKFRDNRCIDDSYLEEAYMSS